MNYLSPDMLLTVISNKMGLKLSNYYKWLYDNKDKFPSSNYLVSADEKGNLYWTEDFIKKQQEFYDLKEKMQYYVLIDGEE